MCAAITTIALSAGASAYTIANAEKQKKDAKRALDSYVREPLDNAYENLPISTMGSDLLREENARASANIIDALQNGGTRALIGGVPKVVAATNNINQEAANRIDDQYNRRAYAIAGDNARIEGIKENRDIANIAGLSSQYNAGKQDSMNGIMGAANTLAYAGRNIDFSSPNPEVTALPNGAMPLYQPPLNIEASTLNPSTASVPYGTNSAPVQYPDPYFDFQNSYTPANAAGGPNQYNPFFNFGTSYNGY